jgi:signal transduction histidine kinase
MSLMLTLRPSRASRRFASVAALLAAIVGLATLSQHVFGWDLKIDLLLIKDMRLSPETIHPGRMSLAAALDFLLLGSALFALNRELSGGVRPAQYAGVVASIIGLLAFISASYGLQPLYLIPGYSAMSTHTAISLIVLSLGIVFARPDAGLMTLVTSDTAGAATIRRLLPPIVGLLPLLGWLRLRGEQIGYFDAPFGVSLMVIVAITVCGGATWWHAVQLHRTDLQRRGALHRLQSLTDELEQRVADRTAALEAANKELEAFSYTVAHDLRAPLRAMDGFSRLLVEEHASALPADGQRYAGIVRENAQQMARLVDDLLAFARLGRQPVTKETVEIAALVRQVLADLRPQQEGRRVAVIVGDMPGCSGDPSLLKQVFANLIGNALKFTRLKDDARVDVGASRDDQSGETVYFVKDNGAGFDMRYAHKLFGVFQRLHRTDEYEGTGVGLASVHRIIQRHGGRIWAEAEPGRGAAFYFTIGGAPS